MVIKIGRCWVELCCMAEAGQRHEETGEVFLNGLSKLIRNPIQTAYSMACHSISSIRYRLRGCELD